MAWQSERFASNIHRFVAKLLTQLMYVQCAHIDWCEGHNYGVVHYHHYHAPSHIIFVLLWLRCSDFRFSQIIYEQRYQVYLLLVAVHCIRCAAVFMTCAHTSRSNCVFTHILDIAFSVSIQYSDERRWRRLRTVISCGVGNSVAEHHYIDIRYGIAFEISFISIIFFFSVFELIVKSHNPFQRCHLAYFFYK